MQILIEVTPLKDKSYLLEDDETFIIDIQQWVRSSLSFSLLGRPAELSDLLFVNDNLPSRFGVNLKGFISIKSLITIAEDNASNQMIYEAWLDDAFRNINVICTHLNFDDAKRLTECFKQGHGINDESQLFWDAQLSLKEARLALYGDPQSFV